MIDLDILAKKYNTDKQTNSQGQAVYHGYTTYYKQLFDNIRTNKMNVLEIGVREGASHKMWEEYFENSVIYGVDNLSDIAITDEMKSNYVNSLQTERIKIFIGDQSDEKFMTDSLPSEFDIIIDDGSHRSWHQQKTLNFMFKKLKSGGIYVIEDLACCHIREFREHDDYMSSTLHWLHAVKNGHYGSYYLTDFPGFIESVKSIEMVDELGIIIKK
jgi:SAM-dependent methyltransferase